MASPSTFILTSTLWGRSGWWAVMGFQCHPVSDTKCLDTASRLFPKARQHVHKLNGYSMHQVALHNIQWEMCPRHKNEQLWQLHHIMPSETDTFNHSILQQHWQNHSCRYKIQWSNQPALKPGPEKVQDRPKRNKTVSCAHSPLRIHPYAEICRSPFWITHVTALLGKLTLTSFSQAWAWRCLSWAVNLSWLAHISCLKSKLGLAKKAENLICLLLSNKGSFLWPPAFTGHERNEAFNNNNL